jgi:hypothetical protein
MFKYRVLRPPVGDLGLCRSRCGFSTADFKNGYGYENLS